MLKEHDDEAAILLEAPSGARLGFGRQRRVASAIMCASSILLLLFEIAGITTIQKSAAYGAIYSNGLGVFLAIFALLAAMFATVANEESRGCFLLTMLVTQV